MAVEAATKIPKVNGRSLGAKPMDGVVVGFAAAAVVFAPEPPEPPEPPSAGGVGAGVGAAVVVVVFAGAVVVVGVGVVVVVAIAVVVVVAIGAVVVVVVSACVVVVVGSEACARAVGTAEARRKNKASDIRPKDAEGRLQCALRWAWTS